MTWPDRLRRKAARCRSCAGAKWGIFPGNATAFVPAAPVIAHLVIRNNCLAWSGYNASGDPVHHHALVVDVGRDFLITSEGKLYLNSPGPLQFAELGSPHQMRIIVR